jgi:hypothetical protein
MRTLTAFAAILAITTSAMGYTQEPDKASGVQQSETSDSSMSENHPYKHDHRKMKGLPSSTNSKTGKQSEMEQQNDTEKKHDHRKDHKHQ